MLVYRIGSYRRIRDLQGTGGLYVAGRWHQKGTRVLYTSSSVSLAKLEVLANSVGKIPRSLALITLEFPDDAPMQRVSVDQLPVNWQQYPYPTQLSQHTEAWLKDGASWIVQVPSAQSPTEYNYLFNPQHPMHHQLKIVELRDELFDLRFKQ
uniref:RES family NAD+ phosphorylase n=1 Tax=Roseihalotalea indica TaxID=2867963 RepID=A0AA49GIQ1_9BACT|nr:RES family NAD+ phosphorylase [Tunicatimonas sp. TK19036]